MDEQSDSAASQCEDEHYDNSHDDSWGNWTSGCKYVQTIISGKIAIFKVIHANKCADDESLSNESRIECLNAIHTLYDKVGYKTSLDQYMTSSTKIR